MPLVPEPSLASFLSTERKLVEDPAIELMGGLGWHTSNLFNEAPGPNSATGRRTFKDALLPKRLWAALRKLNPELPDAAIQAAVDALSQDRSAMLPIAANRELAVLLRDGVPVELRQDDSSTKPVRVKLLDW